MTQFTKIALIFLACVALSASAMKCYSCTGEKDCENAEEIKCNDDYGCSKVTNNKPNVYSKGCFSPLGVSLVNKGECKQVKIGDIEGNYCRCNDKELCNSAGTFSFAAISVTGLLLLAKLMNA